jgi:phosphotransferase system HPr-like phosphotransfer protein
MRSHDSVFQILSSLPLNRILELMALEAPSGSVIEIHAEGKEAKTAVDTIAQILRT